MKCVGIQAYGGSLTLAATNAGLTPIAQLESEKEYHRIAARFFDERLVILDQDHKWDEAMQWLESESIDIVYGQPVWKTGNAVNNYVSTKQDVDDMFDACKRLLPRAIIMAAPWRARKQIKDRVTQSLGQYHWVFIRTNALLHGLPQDKDVMFVMGFKHIENYASALSDIPKLAPKDFNDISDIPKLWDNISYLADIDPVANGSKSDGVFIKDDNILISSHVLPGKKKSVLSRILWESIPILKEGQTFGDVEDRPAVFHEKGGYDYFLKGQLPIRFHRDLPATSIYAVERYIHPDLDRPLSLRELAGLYGVPTNFDLGTYFGPGLSVLGKFTPIPAGEWVFNTIKHILSNTDKNEDCGDIGANPEFDLFTKGSRDVLSQLKKNHGKWVDAYAKKIVKKEI